MKLIRVFAVALMALTILGLTVDLSEESRLLMRDESAGQQTNGTDGLLRVAVICFLKGEQISGMNKICYYDCLGSIAAITIGAVQLCPLSIDR